MRRLAILALVAGCGFDKKVGGAPVDSAQPESNDPCTKWTFQPKDFDPCMIAPADVPPPLFTGTYVINSENGMMRGAGGPFQLPYAISGSVGVVSFTGLMVQQGVTIRTEGMRPLVIASTGSIQIDGFIDVSSNRSQTGGGANPTTCGPSAGGPGTTRTNGDGGAGGGGNGAPGGLGGEGSNVAMTGGSAGSRRLTMPETIEGGCPGGSTPSGDLGTPGGPGSGGGGIALVARETLVVNGIVHAGGSGGGGANQNQNAGGGGGSGGMIRIEASLVMFGAASVLAANGGQGGGGCDGSAAMAGVSGLAQAMRAFSANRQGNAGDGGGGGWRDAPMGEPGSAGASGGGGGGGGVGYIAYKGHTMTMGTPTVASPTPTPF